MTRRALIGHTGFVGSNLDAAENFTDRYNSSNVEAMAGERFDEIVCAGVSAVKWMANREPEQDWAGIRRLLNVLERTDADAFTLISTIDVYPDPAQPIDETANLSGIENHAYGRHRLAVEAYVRERFPHALIVRLPALFGPGLKKNALYDLLNDNGTQNINPAASFQWYPLERLAADIATATEAGLDLVNLFPEPVEMASIVETFFPGAPIGEEKRPVPSYALKTAHAETFGGANGWIMDDQAVLAAMGRYVEAVRGAGAS